MSQATREIPVVAPLGKPVYEIAELFPEQGSWSEKKYLALDSNRLVEFDNGNIEVLPLPKKIHQRILIFLFKIIEAFIESRKLGGLVLVAGYKIRIPGGKYREPDVLYLTPEQEARSNEDFTDAAELLIEVVSPDDPDRDYVKKRQDYSAARVPEYWIVDRDQGHIIVLRLDQGTYVEHGRFTAGQQATSHRFPGLAVSVDAILALGRQPRQPE